MSGPIREAVAEGDYERALDLWQKYTAGLAAQGLTKEALDEAGELLEWARPLVNASRARAQERLRALHVAGVYVRSGL